MRKKKPNQREPGKPEPSVQLPHDNLANLRHTKLERRRLLNAHFELAGTTLTIDNFFDSDGDPGDNKIIVDETATDYLFLLEDGDFTGTDGGGVSAGGSDILMVNKTVAGLLEVVLDSNGTGQFAIEFRDFDFAGEFEIASSGVTSFGDVFQSASSDLTIGGLFDVSGALNIDLENSSNDFFSIDIDNANSVMIEDANHLVVSGLGTVNGDARLTVGGDLAIQGSVSVGSGDLLLDVDGNLTQSAAIEGNGLALIVSGDTTLQHAGNDLEILALDNDGTTLINDIDDAKVGTVTVFDGTIDEHELVGITTGDDDVKLIVGDDPGENLTIEQAISLGTGDLFLDVAGDVNQSGPGTITAAGLGLMVDGDTQLQLGNNVGVLAAASQGTTLYNNVDGLIIGTVTVLDGTANEMEVVGINTSGEDVKLVVGDNPGENLSIEQAIGLGTGDLFLDVAGNATQLETITAAGLALQVDGTTRLNLDNDVATLAAQTGGTILFNDRNGLTVGTVTVLDGTADQMQLVGINTSDDDVKLIVGDAPGENLSIEQAISLGTGDLFLDVGGDVNQSGSGTVTAAGLGLMVDGNTRLQLDNNVDILAAAAQGTILYNDVDGLIIDTVTVLDGTADEMEAVGINTSSDDVKLVVGDDVGENLSIEQAINTGSGDVFLDVGGELTQTGNGTIVAAGLGLMVDGNTRLQLNNDVDTLAASTNDTILFNDVDGMTVGIVTVLDGTADQMQLAGITTIDDDVKLIVGDTVGENLTIEQAINLGTGDLFLDVAGNVTQSNLGTITSAGLGLMVDGNTRLQLNNDADTLAADTDGTILFNDSDGLTVGTVTVLDGTADQMQLIGITTSDDDVKLIVGDAAGENLSFEQAINVGTGDLFLDVAGDVNQSGLGTITAAGLGLMVDGNTRLQLDNDADTLTAAALGTILFNNVDGLIVDTVTVFDGMVDEMELVGIITSGDDVKLIVGDAPGENLAIEQAINTGSGDLFLDVAGELTQTGAGTITAAGLGLMVDGTVRLQLGNDADTLTIATDSTVLYNDINGVTIGTVTVLDGTADQMQLVGITTSDDDVKLIVGDAAGENLSIEQAINVGTGDLFLDVGGDVNQSGLGSVTAAGLGLMVDGNTRLQLENDVDTLAAATQGTILFNDIDGLIVDTVTVLDGTVDEMEVVGITTSDDDVKLIVGDAPGENLSFEQAINTGSGDLFLDVAGELTQTGAGTITAAGLGLMVDGTIRLQLGNDADTLAIATDSTVLYNDINGVTIGTVTVLDGTADQMQLVGITTTNDDVKLIVGDAAGENLSIEQAINLGMGDLFLDVGGNVSQSGLGTITAAGLGLMVDGNTRLQLENDVDRLAAATQGTILFNDVDGLIVNTVTVLDGTVDEMELVGITTSDDDVKLIVGDAPGENLSIEQAISLGTGDLFLDVGGDVNQSGLGTITAAGLGLMVDGNTRLQLNNDVDTLAANTNGTILFNDVDGLTVGIVTVLDGTADQMQLVGITTSNDDVKLIVGDAPGENLSIEQAIDLGTGDLFLDVAGDVNQSALGTITAAGLGLMVDGNTRLQLENDVDTLAANTNGTILSNDVDGLTVGIVTVLDGTADEMQLVGITTSDDDVKLIVGDAPGENLSIEQAINLGTGDLFLDVAGDVNQSGLGTITAAGLGLMVDGNTRLQLNNDVDTLAANTNGTILFNDVDGLTVGVVTVLDGTADQMQLVGITTSDDDVKLIVGDAAGENLTIEQAINTGNGDLFLDVAGELTQTGGGTITVGGLGLMVDGAIRLQLGNDADTLAIATDSTVLYNDIDGVTIGTVTVLDGTADQMQLVGITTSNDDVKLIVGDAPGENLSIEQAINVGTGDLFLDVGGDVNQSGLGTITAAGLGLMVDGNTRLQLENDVDTLAAVTLGTILFNDVDGLIVDTVTVLDGTVDEMEVVGITTTDDDVKLIVGDAPGESLSIEQAINTGGGDLFLDVAGELTQTGAGTITAAGLGLMVDGTIRLQLGNDADTLAIATDSTVLYNDINGLTIGTVTVLDGTADQMQLVGITTSNDDVKLIVGDAPGENLSIEQAIDLGTGDLFLDVAGDLNQSGLGTITSAGLGLMVDGNTRLQLENDVDTLAANTNGTILYNDVDGLTVGIVTVLDGTADQMQLVGITTSDDDVKLIVGDAAGENLSIEQAISLGTGDLFLDVGGNVNQSGLGTITAAGLGLMVDGNTRLQLENDVDTLAANTNGTILFNDVDGLTVGVVTVLDGTADEMELVGITTSDDDVKLIVGDAAGENLTIEQAINTGNGDLFLDVAGELSQTGAGTITAGGLGLMVDGTIRLQLGNDTDTLAIATDSTVLYNDINGVTIGTVTVLDGTADQMQLVGITTSNDDVKLIVGDALGENLSIEQAINLGTGDLFLDVAEDVNQSGLGTIAAAGLGLMVDGNTRLQLENDVDTLAANTNGTILFNDVDGLTVGIVTVLDGTADQMQLVGITTSNDDVKLIVGDAPGENLSIEQAISLGTGDLFLDVAGDVNQSGLGTITAAGLGLMVDGNTRLQLNNDVNTLAASTDGTILFNDVDGLTVGIVTVLDGTADEMQLVGITTSNDDVKLIVGDAAGENLSIEQAINLGTGDLFLDVAGDVNQSGLGTITAAGLGLMVDGNTRLQLSNDVDTLAANTNGTILFNDVDGLTVGIVTVLDGTADQMQLVGITTSDDDVKLIVGDAAGENLSIEQAINLGTGDLFLDVAGNVDQSGLGTITAAGLGLMVDGNTRLQLDNDVDTLAANTNGTILFNDVDGLTVGIVTVLDGTADQMQLVGITTSDDDVKLIVGDAAGENLTIEQAINTGNGDLFLDVAGELSQTGAGTITAGGLGLMVDGAIRLQLGNDADTLAIAADSTVLYNDINGVTIGTVTVLDGTADQMQLVGITTTNDDVKLIVGDAPGENLSIEQAINVGTGDLFLDVAGDVNQSGLGTITAAGLGLMVDGNTRLQLENDVDTLAANTNGTILFNDVDGLTVGTVTVLDGTADQMQLVGITTSNDDVKLIVGDAPGENLSIEQAISLGTGDLFLDVAGDVNQSGLGTITAAGLGLMVDGNTRLQLENDVDTLAANTNGTILYNDVDGLTVGIVTVLDGTADEMQLVGITTSNDDVKLIVGDAAGENLSIEQAINLGTGDLFLDVAGDVNQSGLGTITAAGLGLMVDGNTRLQLNDDVDTLAANTNGTILFNDVDGLTVGIVTVLDGTADQMQLVGITTSDDDVKLVVGDAPGENLSIEQAINLGTGDLFLDVAGNVDQSGLGTITAAGLSLMVDGNTRLQLDNDVDTLAANTNGTILFNDVDGLTVGIVTVLDGTADEMQLVGISTSDDDVKLIVGDAAGENLSIEQAINIGTGDLFLDVAGDVNQSGLGTITATGLGLMVDGNTRLQLDNDVDTLAANTNGTILFNDVDGLTVGIVTALDGTADEMQLVGITTSNDDVKLIVGNAAGENLSIEQAISLGTGDLFLDVAGDVNQSGLGTITAAGLGLMVDGNTRLQLENDVDTLAANTNATILFNDVDGLTVGIVTVLDGTADEMQLVGITTSDDDVKLIVGDAAGENLSIEQNINLGAGDLFLDVAGNVNQSGLGTITAAGLGLMVDGNTRLQLDNDADTLAASTDGTILFNDVDGLTVGIVTVLDGTADEMQLVGITTSNDDVKLIVGDAPGENLSIEQAISLGTGDLFLDVGGDVNQSGLGTITAAGLGLMVDGNTRLQLNNDVDTLAANTNGTILFNDVDGLTVGIVTVLDGTADEMQLVGITTSNDDVKLIVGDAAGENLSIEQAINLGTGDLFLDVAGEVNQSGLGTITAAGLGLMVDGNTRLQLNNDVDTLAANTNGTILFNDVDGLTVGIVTVLDGTADEMQLVGITTSDDDVKLIVGDAAGENLSIEQAINLGTGDLFLDVAGDVNQSGLGTITAAGLGLMVDGNTRLQLENDVDTLAANTNGTILFNDVDGLTVGTVTVLDGTADQMQLVGITTSNDDVKLIVGGNLAINEPISIGAGNLFLAVEDNITQTAAITANGLALMVGGTTELLNPGNDVNVLAVDAENTTRFLDSSGFKIGTVTVDSMTVKGVDVVGDFVLIANGDISQDADAPVVVSGLTDLTTTGNICWTFGDCFGGENGADGQNDNDFNELRIQSATNADIVDANRLTVSLATVDGQLRLAAGDSAAGQLTLSGNIGAADQVLLQASAGVIQTAGILTTDQLLIGGDAAKESTGDFRLTSDNVVAEIAASVSGDLQFTNIADLNVSVLDYDSICGSMEGLSGVDVGGNLILDLNAVGVPAAGNLTQSDFAPVLVGGTTVINASGNIVLLGNDRDPFDGGNANNFEGVVNINTLTAFRNSNQNFVEIADINQLIVQDAFSNRGIHLFAGTSATSTLELTGRISTNQVLLQSSGGVEQSAADGVLEANELIVGGDQLTEGTAAFILQGRNEVDQLAGNLLNGTLQLQNTHGLTISSGLTFLGSDETPTDGATGIFAGGDGASLVFADPNVFLSTTAQGSVGNFDDRYNPAFELFLDPQDVGIAILNEQTVLVEEGALVNAVDSDIYLETVGDHDLDIRDTVRVDDLSNRILVIAGGDLVLEPSGRLERGAEGLVTTRFNDITLLDPAGNASDQNRLVDRNFLTQTLEFIFGDRFESNFDAGIFWGIEGKSDNTFDFGSLDPSQLAALDALLFGGSIDAGFESRSFYSTVTLGATIETLISDPIDNLFDNSNTVSDAAAIPTASFTLDFLRNNAEFRSIVFVFNDANINMFQSASTGEVEDLNVATADFEGLARFNEPSRIAITRPVAEALSQIEVIPRTDFEILQTSFRVEDPLFVQAVQQKFFIVVYFNSQFEADQFELLFGDDELEYEQVLELLDLESNALKWSSSGEGADDLDANQIREIISRANLDLEDEDQWIRDFTQWLKNRNQEENNSQIPDVPRGVYKILEVENGKAVIQGDDVDRKFVPEPGLEESDPGKTSPEIPEIPLDSEKTQSDPDNSSTLMDPRLDVQSTSNQEPATRVARWSAMLRGEPVDDGTAAMANDHPSDEASVNLEEPDLNVHTVKSAAAPLLGLLAALTRRKTKSDLSVNEEQRSTIDEKAEYRDRNIFSSASRFRRRVERTH